MSDKNDVCVGVIAGAFGVRGDVRVKSFTALPENIAGFGPVHTQDGALEFEITLKGQAKSALVVRLSGIATKEEADALKGVKLFVARAQLPQTEEDEFYYEDLIGMAVFDTGGQLLGKVKAVLNHGAGDILEISGPPLTSTVLMPFTKEAVPTVDITASRIIVDPPEGILPDDPK